MASGAATSWAWSPIDRWRCGTARGAGPARSTSPDPDYPEERLQFMVADAGVKVLLVHSST
jgi:non-ribosomal peptide synthetase component F